MVTPPNPKVRVAISPDVLDQYVGTFQASDQSLVRVRREEEHLILHLPGRADISSFPTSEIEFISDVVDATQTFVLDNDRRAAAMIFREKGRDLILYRIEDQDKAVPRPSAKSDVRGSVSAPLVEAALFRLMEAGRHSRLVRRIVRALRVVWRAVARAIGR